MQSTAPPHHPPTPSPAWQCALRQLQDTACPLDINESAFLLRSGLLALHLPDALPALLEQPHAELHDFLLLVAQPRQQAAHQRRLVLLQELGSHVLEQVGRALESGLAHLRLRVGQGDLEGYLHVLEVAPRALSDQDPAESDQCVLADSVLVVLEVFDERLGDGGAVLPKRALHLGTEIVDQLAGFLHERRGTFLISALGSSRHLARALASSAMWKAKDSLKARHPRSSWMIFSRRSSLFSGKGELLTRWMRPWTSGSDYYFLRAALAMTFSRRERVSSRLASMGSPSVQSRFLQRLVVVRILIWFCLLVLSSSFSSVASPLLRMFRSWSVRQLIDRCSPCSSTVQSSPYIQNNLKSKPATKCLPIIFTSLPSIKSREFANNQFFEHSLIVSINQIQKKLQAEMSKQAKGPQNAESFRNGLTTRLQQIIEVLYKNNGQFSKGLPSEHQFQEMLTHCYNCYDQLDFIILEYSKHPVNYLEPKLIAEHMHRIMRVTKYLLSNVRHWIESYSLDIVKKAWEEKSYFSAEAVHQARCASCNRYVEEIVLKEAKEEILGFQDMREIFEQELREEKEEETTKKPLTVRETTEYVGSVNYLTKIIKEMEDSAHGYSKLTEVIEKEDNHQDMALRYLEDLLSSMRRRLGEKCIYRLKRVIKNWEKIENQEHESMCKKPLFRIKQIISQTYIPTVKNEIKKSRQATTSAGILKKIKEEKHQLQVENNTINSAYTAAKNSLAFLQKREEIQKREIQRLNDLLEEQTMEKSSLARELKISRRNTINPQAELAITSPKATVSINVFAKQKMLGTQHKNKKYSKFKVKRMSRQSQAFSNGTDKTFDFTNGENLETESGNIDQSDGSQEQQRMVDVGCQWEEPYPSERAGKLKDKSSRNSKIGKSNTRQRINIPKISKIDEEEILKRSQQQKSSKDKKRSLKALDPNIKSRPNLKPDNSRLSLQDQKILINESHTIKKLIESQQQRNSHAELDDFKEAADNCKTSVKVLENEPSAHKISLEKINIYGNSTKVRELKPLALESKTINLKDLPEANTQNRFSQEIKKIMNYRMATEGNQVKRKVLRVRNTLFKPEHLSIFGGVSESYNYQRNHSQEEKLTQQEKKCFVELKNYLVNLRSFKNHLYDNIVMFLKCPFTLIDKDQLKIKIVGDKQLTSLLKKFIAFHWRKCQRITCQHLQVFNTLIGMPHFE